MFLLSFVLIVERDNLDVNAIVVRMSASWTNVDSTNFTKILAFQNKSDLQDNLQLQLFTTLHKEKI